MKKRSRACSSEDSKSELDPPQLRPLYQWYRKSHRKLPFRETREVYPIWVSEVMLQQTRVAAMLPKYIEFTKRFPDLASLAASREEDVLAAWQGLGYYSRARNLRKGARYIINECAGEFPRELSAALKVPGVGPYTAAAILSIALNQPTAVLDGNVKRVLDRLLGLSESKRGEAWTRQNQNEASGTPEVSTREYQAEADRLMHPDVRGSVTGPGDHNQALMELGAVICVPGRPRCERCPVRSECRTFANDPTGELAATLPPKARKPATVELQLDACLIYNRDASAILIARDPNARFFRKLWFFPYRFTGEVYFDPASTPGLSAVPLQQARIYAKGFRHSITHHRIVGRVLAHRLTGDSERALRKIQCACQKDAQNARNSIEARKDRGEIEWRWLPVAEVHETIVSSLARKIEAIVNSAAAEESGATGQREFF